MRKGRKTVSRAGARRFRQLSSPVRHLRAPIILTVVVVRCGSPQIQLNQQRTRLETGDRSGAWGAGPGRARQSVQSSLKNVYGTAVFRLPGLAAVVQSRAGLKTDGTDDCEAWLGLAFQCPWCRESPKSARCSAPRPRVSGPWINPYTTLSLPLHLYPQQCSP